MDKVIVISGGSDGFGKEIAKRLTSNNKVIILSPNKEKLESAAKEIGCDFEVCDVTNCTSVESAIESVNKKYSKIDCLINNAGVWIEGAIDSNEFENIKKVIDVNVLGVIYMTKAVVSHMKENKKGLIINIISQAGINAKTERSVYTSSKFAITGFTKSLQLELAKFGISVTGIYPGKMNTKLFEKSGNPKDMNDSLDPKEAAKIVDFLLSLDSSTVVPEIGIKSLES